MDGQTIDRLFYLWPSIKKMKILFVCLGNICRSPIAEGVFKQLCEQEKIDCFVESAGTQSYHVGESPHRYSILVCNEKGIDITQQRAAKFKVEDIVHYDKIYALANDVYDEIKNICGDKFDENKIELFLNQAYPNKNRSVKDPWYGNLDGYYEVFDEIKLGCKAILHSHKKFD
jgi:protein-tyrosine phosphatase